MFSNAIFYRIKAGLSIVLEQLEEALQSVQFMPCGATQAKSSGWVPPRGIENGALVEVIGGQYILRLMTETKAVPSAVVKRKVDAMVAKYKEETGRERVGSKIKKEFKEEAMLALLPVAFAKQAATMVWIDPAAGLLVIEAASHTKGDEVVTLLVAAMEGFSIQLVNTVTSPTAIMSEWLVTQEPPSGFSVDRECELKAADESKATIKYGCHPLDIDEVKAHVEAGMRPTRLAMTWDSRVSFILTEGLQLKKLAFLEVVFEGQSADKADSFDADVAIATGELRKLIPDLLEAMGGEVVAVAPLESEAGTPAAPVPYTGDAENDPLYEQAMAVVVAQNRASISLVQRHLNIGYNRAARLIERMETEGMVSAMDTTGARKLVAA